MGDAVVRGVQDVQARIETEILSPGAEVVEQPRPPAIPGQRLDVLEDERSGAHVLDDLEEGPYVTTAGILRIHAPGDTETLAGRAPDDDVGRPKARSAAQRGDVARDCGVARKRRSVRLQCDGIDVVGPDRLEAGPAETDVETPTT